MQKFSNLPATYVPVFFSVIGPTSAAILLRYRYEGSNGVEAILRRLKPLRSQLFAYLWIPIMSLVLSLILFILIGLEPASIFSAIHKEWQILLGHIFFQLLLVGILEEVGWRGWMLPHLLKRFNLAKATIMLASIWSVWHFPKLIGPWAVSGPFVLLSISASVILSFLWVRYRANLFLLAIAHGSINFPVFFLETLMEKGYFDQQQLLDAWLAYALAYVIFAFSIILLEHRIWLKHHEVTF